MIDVFANLCISEFFNRRGSEADFANRAKNPDDAAAKSERVFFCLRQETPARLSKLEFLADFSLRFFVANRFQRSQYRLKNRTLEERAHVNRVV